jgi:hypothetical protein
MHMLQKSSPPSNHRATFWIDLCMVFVVSTVYPTTMLDNASALHASIMTRPPPKPRCAGPPRLTGVNALETIQFHRKIIRWSLGAIYTSKNNAPIRATWEHRNHSISFDLGFPPEVADEAESVTSMRRRHHWLWLTPKPNVFTQIYHTKTSSRSLHIGPTTLRVLSSTKPAIGSSPTLEARQRVTTCAAGRQRFAPPEPL